MTNTELASQIAALAEKATLEPFVVYGEPEVGLPASLFVGAPGQPGFRPFEPINDPCDQELIALFYNNHYRIIAALRAADEVERLREALKPFADCGDIPKTATRARLPIDDS